MRDVVYPYKKTPDDFEIRYSLRSLKFARHGRVIVAGDRPSMTSDAVLHVPVERIGGDRFASSTANILAAAEASEAREIIVMHDDIFLLKPWKFRHENRGTIDAYLGARLACGMYRARVEWTRDVLRSQGVREPLWFGLHTPTVYDRQALIDVIREFGGSRYLLRTLYHNLFPRRSVRQDDVKVRRWTGCFSGDVLSIADAVPKSRAFRQWIAECFPVRCSYEADFQHGEAAAYEDHGHTDPILQQEGEYRSRR